VFGVSVKVEKQIRKGWAETGRNTE
jgi:hypothetical protein